MYTTYRLCTLSTITDTHMLIHTQTHAHKLLAFATFQIKELRNQGDEVARELSIHGLNSDLVPPERRTFEELMKLVSQ